jgi:hypothetical protein
MVKQFLTVENKFEKTRTKNVFCKLEVKKNGNGFDVVVLETDHVGFDYQVFSWYTCMNILKRKVKRNF